MRAATTEGPGLGTGLAVLAPLYGRADNPAEQPEQTVMKQPISEVDVEAIKAGAADYLIKGEIDSGLLERAAGSTFTLTVRDLRSQSFVSCQG